MKIVFGQAASGFSVTMSNSGDKTNPSYNPFAVNTTDKNNASVPVFGSTGNSGHNPFSVNTNGNASTSAFGNMTNSIHNPFAVNTTGNASMSGFGNPNNSAPNPFAVNTTGNASVSSFGNRNNSSSNPFANNTNGNASLSTFGNMTNATHNPFAVNTTGNASVSVFGNPSNPAPNPFAVNANGNASMSNFGNPSNPTPNPFALNTNGNATFGNTSNPPPNPFAVKPPENSPMPMFWNTNSTCNPFAGNTFSNTTSPSFPFRGITFEGTSTGQFGAPPSSVLTSPLTFGVPAAPAETSGTPAAFTNHMRNNAFGWGPGGSAPSSFSQSSGLKFGPSSNSLFGTIGLMTSTSAGTNISVSNAGSFSLGSTKPCSSPQFSFGLNKGSKIKPYAATKNPEDSKEQFLSISSMPVYKSKSHEELRWEDYELKSGGTPTTVSTGSFPCPVSQFPISNITPTALNPFSPSPIPSLNFTPSNPTTAASLSNSAPSSTTTPVFTLPSSPFQTPSFPKQDPSSNSTPSTNITSVFNQPPSSVLNTSFTSLTPLSNSNPWPFTQLSTLNSIPANPLNLIPPSTSTPSFTKPTDSGNSVPNTSFPTPNPSFNFTAPSLIQPSTSNPWALTQPSTLTETGKSQINPAPSALASYNSPGNHGGSTDKAVDCIIAVKDPFGPQSVSSHPLTDYCICSPLIQNGISGMPVIDKPATTRVSSLVTSRHIPQRPLTMRARKYNPKSDGPKVPFFDHIDETPSTQKESTFIIPRENPRSVFEATPNLSGVSCVKAAITDASTSLHDLRLKSKTDEASSSTPCNLESQKSVNEKWQQVNPSASVPKLQRPDYYTQPSIQELLSAESNDPGFCSHVQDFVVGRHGYGEVKFEGETDVRGLDLDALVSFNKREVIVYEDEHEKPEIGEGLNKQAEVTLLNVKCSDKTGKEYKSGKMVDKFLEKLKKVAEEQGAEFVSYDAVNGVWKFQVQHF
ncbi:nuclear pore complex protein NUP98A-like [Silene latifolia]|uniref:nuclear pore complex protein NUP98A-like n=1 Tax=Silene latifolia TaxID=37657 RepID=UPI003D782462